MSAYVSTTAYLVPDISAFSFVKTYTDLSANHQVTRGMAGYRPPQGGVADDLRYQLNEFWSEGQYSSTHLANLRSLRYSRVEFKPIDAMTTDPTKRIECIKITPNYNNPDWEDEAGTIY